MSNESTVGGLTNIHWTLDKSTAESVECRTRLG